MKLNSVIKHYAVLDSSGRVKRTRKVRQMYSSQKRAEQGCTVEGDSVVEVYIDLGVAPLFIRGKTL